MGSAGRVTAGGSRQVGVGEHARACMPPGLYKKDLTGVRSRYTRSGSGSLGASVAGAASSGSTCRGKESQVVFSMILTPCLRAPVPCPCRSGQGLPLGEASH